MNNVIEIKGLSKSFGNIHAVNDISFTVERGSLFAFLGVNGAGKSTTISMVCGSLIPDKGEIYVNGYDIKSGEDEIKRSIGVVFQGSVLDKPLSVFDNLKYRASLYGICGDDFKKRMAEVEKLLDMDDILKRPYGKLSGGQKRRADIARALIHSPSILILDEPTTGLDPQTRKKVWEVISYLRESQGLTVFLTTHYMEEAADADKVVIIDSGKIVAEGTPVELKNRYTGDFITVYGKTETDMELLGVKYEKVGDGYRFKVENTADAKALIVSHPDFFDDYEIVKGKMDDVFLAATGKRLSVEDEKNSKKGGRSK